MSAVVPSRRIDGSKVAVAIVALTSTFVVAVAGFALRGTRWSFGAVYSDSAFRTQAVTRYAQDAAWGDYAYQGLPAYYPPLWPWLQGRVADLLGVPGWTVMQPATLVLAALVPFGAYLLWRRVVPDVPAALVVCGTTLACVDLQKVDEWLVLSLLVPWWLAVVRGVRVEGRRPWPRWAHGVVLGGLLLVHTYYFLPLAVATVLGWGVDLAMRRRPPLRLVDALVIGAVGLAVSAPYWLLMVASRVSAGTTDQLQMRFDPRGFDVPPLPGFEEWTSVAGVVAVVWLVLRLRTSPVAGGLALVLLSGYVVTVGGQLLQRFEVALLPFKSAEVVVTAFVAAAALALVDVWGHLREYQARGPSWRRWVWATGGAALTVGMTASALHATADEILTGRDTRAAYAARYPDGSYPRDPKVSAADREYFAAGPGDPSTRELRRAWRRLAGPGRFADEVIVTDRADLLATTPVHAFATWKSIYSHPNGHFEQRLEFLNHVAACPTSACAARMLGSNPFDPVDGVIARRAGPDLVLRMGVDNYPEGWSRYELRMPLRLFEGRSFRRVDVGPMTVVALR